MKALIAVELFVASVLATGSSELFPVDQIQPDGKKISSVGYFADSSAVRDSRGLVVPSMVGLVVGSYIFCAGSLIGPKWVLTSAHCSGTGKIVTVYIGSNTDVLTNSPVITSTLHVIKHPLFDGVSAAYDVAVIHLGIQVPYTGSIQPVKIAKESEDYAGCLTRICGWDPKLTGPLKCVEATIMPELFCKMAYKYPEARGLCYIDFSGVVGENGIVNTGGPIVAIDSGIQIGLVSFRRSTGPPLEISQVSSFANWIEHVTDLKF